MDAIETAARLAAQHGAVEAIRLTHQFRQWAARDSERWVFWAAVEESIRDATGGGT